MHMKILSKTGICLITVIMIQNPNFISKKIKKVIGKMKDECAGVPIIDFCGLRSKMYSYIKENCKYCCKAKGIKKNVVAQ